MTVKEFKKKLSRFPDDYTVLVERGDAETEVSYIEVGQLLGNGFQDAQDWAYDADTSDNAILIT